MRRIKKEKTDSLERYRCSKHGLDYVSGCHECRNKFMKWAHEHDVNILWDGVP